MKYIPFKFIQLEKNIGLFGNKLGSTATITCHDIITGKWLIERIGRIQGPHKKIETVLSKIENTKTIVTADISVESNGFRSISGFHFWPPGTTDISNERSAIQIASIEPYLEDLENVLNFIKKARVAAPHPC